LSKLSRKTRRLGQIIGYAAFGVRFFLLRSKGPFFLGLVTNDTCNLSCVNCRVANTDNSNMSFEEIREILRNHRRRGVRFLTLAGGEPYLWRDGDFRIRDVVSAARDIGYLNVNIFTNGTLPMDADADFTWISIDGLGQTLQKIRGIRLDRIFRNLRRFEDRYGLVFTVNTINLNEIEDFLRAMSRDLPGIGVLFFFHTPYYGKDGLHLSDAQRRSAVTTLMDAKRTGLPVLNSAPALNAYLAGNPDMPADLCTIVDAGGAYRCCRVDGDLEVCKYCGYSITSELVQARRWKLASIRSLLRAA
jgi:Fe-coproporphyrin III synthase